MAAARGNAQQKVLGVAGEEVPGLKMGGGSEPIGPKQPRIACKDFEMFEWRLPRGRQLIELRLHFGGKRRREGVNSHGGFPWGGQSSRPSPTTYPRHGADRMSSPRAFSPGGARR